MILSLLHELVFREYPFILFNIQCCPTADFILLKYFTIGPNRSDFVKEGGSQKGRIPIIYLYNYEDISVHAYMD